ncbi:MAG: hypothetical protein WCD52_08945 [Xanthobacteraceae bacterium]
MPDWVALLIDQTDDCLLHIERGTGGHLSTEVQQRLSEIAYGIGELNLSRDLCALSRATDGSSKLDLKAVWEELQRLLNTNAAREAELREPSIKPFRENIEAMIKDFRLEHVVRRMSKPNTREQLSDQFDSDLSFPKIISGRSDDAAPTERA